MIFGVCAGPTGKVDRYAAPSVAEVGGELHIEPGRDSIAVAYNALVDRVRGKVDGLILIHDDLVIEADPRPAIADAFAQGAVIVGVMGGRAPKSLAWWGSSVYGRAMTVDQGMVVGPDGPGTYEVDTLDGIVLALSPWALEHLRFDEGYRGFDGYDGDICAQARAQDRTVMVIDSPVTHYTTGLRGDTQAWRRADWRWKSKWLPRGPLPRALWRYRSLTCG